MFLGVGEGNNFFLKFVEHLRGSVLLLNVKSDSFPPDFRTVLWEKMGNSKEAWEINIVQYILSFLQENQNFWTGKLQKGIFHQVFW